MAVLNTQEETLFLRMRDQVRRHQPTNRHRENLFNARKQLQKIGFSVPESMRSFAATVGWPEKAVMVPARRLKPTGFVSSREEELADELNAHLDSGYAAAVEQYAIEASVRHGCSFVFATPGDQTAGDPDVVLSARSALEASAIVDRRTLRTIAGLEATDEAGVWLMHVPGEVLLVDTRTGEHVVRERYRAAPGEVGVVPYVWDRSLDRPFGRSRITNPVIDLSGQAVRIMLRQEVQAEHFSSPQRVLSGAREEAFTDETGQRRPMWQVATGAIWGIPDFFDEEIGEWRRAELTQMAAASMQPHTDHLRTVAMMFAGETSIPISQLGIVHDNPSSADAIRQHESAMVDLVQAQIPSYMASRKALGRLVLAVAHRGLSPATNTALAHVHARFADPGTITRAALADRAQKFAAAYPELRGSSVALRAWGFDDVEVRELQDHLQRAESAGLVRQLLEAGPGVGMSGHAEP
ncbi:phage portal protein [Micrococcus luteus]|nr:phage portal protein [Micrococcus luteus]